MRLKLTTYYTAKVTTIDCFNIFEQTADSSDLMGQGGT